MSTLQRVGSQDHLNTTAQVRPETTNTADQQVHLVLRLQPGADSERTSVSEEVTGQALNPALAAALSPCSAREVSVERDEWDAPPNHVINDFDNPDPQPRWASRVWDVLYPVGVAIVENAPGAYDKISAEISSAYAAAYPVGVAIVEGTPGAVATIKTYTVLILKVLYEGSKPLYKAVLDGCAVHLGASRTIDDSGKRRTQHDGWQPNIVPWNDPYNVQARLENPNSSFRNGRPMQ